MTPTARRLSTRRLTPLLLALAAALLTPSCEKEEASLMTRLEEALKRKPAAHADKAADQPDPQQLLADEPDSVIPPPPEPVKMEPVINKNARVSILGYHDFTDGRSTNDMIINVDDFRSQLQAIKDSGLPVISMSDFLAWKKGEKDIPAESVMITIDDGWKATHTLAMPVLREFGYPYTVFLYKKYIGVGGRSLSHDEVKELMANGADIGSHSVSHQNMASRSGRSASEHTAWLKTELEDSWNYLNEHFGAHGQVLKTFAYPFGIYSEEAVKIALDFGYEACFTVNGKKTKWEDPDAELGRYVVHGRTLANFDVALDFGGGGTVGSGRKLMTESRTETGEVRGPLITTWPADGQVIIDRLPEIQIDVSKLEGVAADSIALRVSGLGRVSHRYDPQTGIISYPLPQRLRTETCGVRLSFKHAGNRDFEIIAWNFKIDRLAGYLPPDALEKLRDKRESAPAEEAPAAEPVPVVGETAAIAR
ncbi:MAG: polysaccharide deacetylase family protein [Verrucomicrobiales bacterium]|nr:polysaccharide deacetylase family protein [Verrucomicrobiales bacterium]